LDGIEAHMFRVKYVNTNTDDIDIYGETWCCTHCWSTKYYTYKNYKVFTLNIYKNNNC